MVADSDGLSKLVAQYTFRIMRGPGSNPCETLDSLSRGITNAEDNINDALPEGYYVKVDEVVSPAGHFSELSKHDNA